MSLITELADWKTKKAEAERNLKLADSSVAFQNKWGNNLRIATENIHRIEGVLAARPWTDEIQAEEQRHFKAVQSIYERYQK